MNDSNTILQHLEQPLDPSRVAKRTGAGSRQLSYLETYDVINRLNEVFGFDGWSDRLDSIERIGDGLWRASVTITARIGDAIVIHSDTGIGVHRQANNEEIEKAVKEAASDALKRAARKFGDQFGNCLYDKAAPEHNNGNAMAMNGPGRTPMPAQRPQNRAQAQPQPQRQNAPQQAAQRPPRPQLQEVPANDAPRNLTAMQELQEYHAQCGFPGERHPNHIINTLSNEGYETNGKPIPAKDVALCKSLLDRHYAAKQQAGAA